MRLFQIELFPGNDHYEIRRDSNPYLSFKDILVVTPENFNLKVPLNPLKEGLNTPLGFVQSSHGGSFESEVIGKRDHGFLCIRIKEF